MIRSIFGTLGTAGLVSPFMKQPGSCSPNMRRADGDLQVCLRGGKIDANR